MPPRRRKKPSDPAPLSLPFTCLFKISTSVLECPLLGHITQFIHLGQIVGLASISASFSGRFNKALSPTVRRFGIPKRFHTSSYALCSHLCSSCPASSGFNLPCSGSSCSNLGNYSSCPWRFLSLDRSASVSLVLGSDFACYGCGRTSSPSSVPVVWTSEPGSATVSCNAPGRLAGLRADGCIGVPLVPLLRGSSCGTVYTRPEWPLPTVSTSCRLLVFRSGSQPLAAGLQCSPWAALVYLGLIQDVWPSTPFVQLVLRTSCVTYKAQHDFKCDMCRRYIGLADHSSAGGSRTSYCSHAQWTDRSSEAHGRVFETRNSFRVQGPFFLFFSFRMYCFHTSVRERIQCITDDAVFFPSGWLSSLVVSCTCYFVSYFEQHFRVLGPCFLALDMHLRMLGQVLARPDYSYCLFLASACGLFFGYYEDLRYLAILLLADEKGREQAQRLRQSLWCN